MRTKPLSNRAHVHGKNENHRALSLVSRFHDGFDSRNRRPAPLAMEPAGKAQGFIFAPEVNCYDCPIKHTYPSCGVACADYVEHMM